MIKPMLAESSSKPFDRKDWLYENKLDGCRCVAFIDGQVRLQARSGADITHKFPELADIHRQAGKPCILDGEIVCQNFNGLQHRIHKEKPLDIKVAMRQYPATYYVFDILNLDGQSLALEPLIQRKATLASNFATGKSARLLAWQSAYGIGLFESVKACGLEGIMAKQMYSPYIEGKRSSSWLKVKCFVEDSFYICGLTRGENERAKTFGSLILGKAIGVATPIVYVGCAGSGLTEEMITYILRVIKPTNCPFSRVPKLDKQVLVWVKPELVCEIRYLGFGSEEHLRFPTFRRLRHGQAIPKESLVE